ncbi:unnamed protein product [Mytilus coruscus]|uniref:Uncharacterized protein n=1 Tax=Mytilus coruscus TaxID=42192 RepID=A0A6J8AC51_MYTCO|nr:unnamed protein product [Mytilus coruscus]
MMVLKVLNENKDMGNRSVKVKVGLPGKEIFVYIICTGLIAFILLVGTFLLRRCKHGKQRGSNTRPCPRGSSSEQLDLHVHATGTSTDAVEVVYENIEELSIPDRNLPVIIHARSQSNENDYSWPDNDSDSLPNDGYLNPYQPMIQNFERHGFSTRVEMSDAGCSGYLNPHQIVVPDQDKHDYYKVKDYSSGLDKNDSQEVSNTDTNSYRSSTEENENQCEKTKFPAFADCLDSDQKDKASICYEENELRHDEDEQTCRFLL